MYKIAILGCENSHANAFLDFLIKEKKYEDIEVAGVYSDEPEAMAKLKEEYGVETADSYDAFVGKVDGIVVTARHGDNHYKYAKPYIASGIPMFIDKPITISEQEAIDFMKELKANGVRVTGGSSCIYQPILKKLRTMIEDGSIGKLFGGYFRAPNVHWEQYGGFYFYSQHLIQSMMTVFGNYPLSVCSVENGDVITSTVRYEECDVTAVLTKGCHKYYAYIGGSEGMEGAEFETIPGYLIEFNKYVDVLRGNDEGENYRDFIAPVFILNAMERSLKNGGAEEKINPVPEI